MSDTVHPSPESTGIPQLDQILGGLYIGDNVVWYDDAGSLAPVFCLNLISASDARRTPVIYVSFDRSPKNLMDKLGRLNRISRNNFGMRSTRPSRQPRATCA